MTECGESWWSSSPNPILLCMVLRFVFSSAALSGFLGNTKYSGILLVPKKVFMPPPRRVCVCSACLAWEGSAPNCPVGEEGSREVCQLPALSWVLHSSSYSEAPQTKRQQRPSGGLSSCWPVIPFWRIMTYSNCKSLGIICNIVHGCFVLCMLPCEIMWLISYVPFNCWICPPSENPHTQTTKFLYNIAAYFASFYAFQSFWGWRLHQLISTCVCMLNVL